MSDLSKFLEDVSKEIENNKALSVEVHPNGVHFILREYSKGILLENKKIVTFYEMVNMNFTVNDIVRDIFFEINDIN